jgi:putative ABC transport system permease protein
MKAQLRRILRSPAIPLAVVATFGLGLGGATLGFALAKAVWLHPLPYRAASRLENVWEVDRRYPRLFSGPGKEAARLLAAAPLVAGQARYAVGATVWQIAGRRVQAGTALVGPRFFRLLGFHAAAGRLPAGAMPEALISPNLAARLGGDKLALGQAIASDGRIFTIVGVAQPGFRFPDFLTPGRPAATEVWLSRVSADRAMLANTLGMRGILVRLQRGAGMARFNREMAMLTRRLRAAQHLNRSSRLAALSLVQEEVGGARTPALVLFLAAMLVLGIAVTNVTLLLLERAWRRRAETGLRLALGGGPTEILRAEIAEILLLALGGAAAGLCLAYVAMPAVRAALPPGWQQGLAAARLDAGMVVFAVALASAIALAAGALVARRVLAHDPLALLRGGASAGPAGARAASAESRGLLAAEIALSVVLATGSIALLQSFAAVAAIRTGMRSRRVISVWVDLPAQGGVAHRDALAERIRQRLARLPGVRAAADSAVPVLAGETFIEPPAHTAVATVLFQHRAVSPGYFRVLGIPLLQGRDFNADDRPGGTPVAIVNRAFAIAGWKGAHAIGHRIRIPTQGHRLEFLVVGVAGDARDNALRAPPRPELYTAMSQTPALPSAAFFLRTSGNPAAGWPIWRQRISSRIWAVVGDVPIASIGPLQAAIAKAQAGPRFRAALLACFAAFGLLLAALGVYAVFAYEVARLERAVAVRLALGATHRRVVGGIVWSGAKVSGLGIGPGVLAGFWALRAMHSLLFGLSSSAAQPLIGAALLLGAAALAACALATRRVFRLQVAQALRAG